MLVQELFEERYDDYVHRLLQTLKIPLLGDGKFSNVFQHPKFKDVAVKVFQWDQGYSEYLKWCRKHQDNPYVPKIIDVVKTKTEDDDLTVVFFEKLLPVNSTFMKRVVRQIALANEVPPADTFMLFYSREWRKIAKNTKDKNLAQIAKYLASDVGVLDLHNGNFMRRGQQLVFIDPFSS